MVVTKATMEKLGEEEIISMFVENYVKLIGNVTQLTNQQTKVDKTLKKNEITAGSL